MLISIQLHTITLSKTSTVCWCPLRMFIARTSGCIWLEVVLECIYICIVKYLEVLGNPYWNVRCLVRGGDGNKGSIVNLF